MCKVCSKCKKEKDFKYFSPRSNRKSGYQSQCKQCRNSYPKNRTENYTRNYDLNKSYGISLDDYNKLLQEQNECCKICNTHISKLNQKLKKNLCVDHCHITGRIRGLLCDKCNRGLGLFNDDENLLLKAINYLKV